VSVIITALVGLLGVLVGALLSSLLQRRNWQLQEAAKIYARLFTVGDEAMRLMNTLQINIDNLAATVQPPATVYLRSKENADVGGAYAHITKMRDDFRGSENREFRHLLKHAWMLERNPGIRALIEKVDGEYQNDCVTLEMHFGKLHDKRQNEIDGQVAKRPAVDRWFGALDRLRTSVAIQYFHAEPSNPEGGAARQGNE
jgi:type II secretory pathway pseudopilin PulG